MPPADKYTDAQREAAASMHVDRGATYARIQEMARTGALRDPTGEPVGTFDPPIETIKTWARRRIKRAAGKVNAPESSMPHPDAIEQLRIRCVNASSKLLSSYERQQAAAPIKADPDKLRQIIRVVREAAALPGPQDPRPPAPGKGPIKDRTGSVSKTGLAGAILADAAGGVPEAPAAGQVPDPSGPLELEADPAGSETAGLLDLVDRLPLEVPGNDGGPA